MPSALPKPCSFAKPAEDKGQDNDVIPREQLEEWVERWLQVNRDAEAAGDWKPMADFYTDDATYGWNIGPKEDVMCLGKAEIRDIALGLEMEGLEGWKYPYQRVVIDDKQGEVVGFEADRRRSRHQPEPPIPHVSRSTASAAAGSGWRTSTGNPRSPGSATSSTSATCRSSIWT